VADAASTYPVRHPTPKEANHPPIEPYRDAGPNEEEEERKDAMPDDDTRLTDGRLGGDDRTTPEADPMFTRRTLLRNAGVAGAGFAASGLLAACGGTGSTTAASKASGTSTTTFQTPSRGGTLRVGMVGNGTSETYNPALISTPIDDLHGYAVFDPFVRVAPNHQRAPGLILDWTHNADATVWELKLRPGVTFHDGKPFTADDVIWTLRSMGNPAHAGHFAVVQVRLNELKKLDKHTVRVPLKIPIADLAAYFVYLNASYVIQDGATKFAKPVGTGPYKLESFVPGQRSVLSANRDYWDQPRPYPDELQIISIDDDTARLNALVAGQIDICNSIPAAEAKAHLAGGGPYSVLVGAPGFAQCFYMRVDQPPFNDVRVRQAMRLVIDRQAMINSALSGFGTVGNDLAGYGVKYYDSSLPQRTQDIAKAKSLLKAAGHSDLRVTLHSSPAFVGFEQAAAVLQQQASSAGITVQVKYEQPAEYFNPNLLYLKESFAQTAWPASSLNAWYSDAVLSTSPFNETHFENPASDRLFYRAQAATDPTQAAQLWNQVQAEQWNNGGYIVWALVHSTDAVSSKARGIGGPGTGWLYGLDDHRVWNWGLA
jgi:peptide/nickel transport system substrate-binding protein